MLNGKKILAVVPARGDSKRVPLKNLTLFKIGDEIDSLLGWAIRHAKECKYVDKVVITSDMQEIGVEDRKAEWRERPTFLCGDKTPMEAVLTHILYCYGGYDYAVLLQPTSPLRIQKDIETCIEIAVNMDRRNDLTGCVSYNPYGKRNGAVYVVNIKHFLEFLSFDAAHHYEMPMERSLDIDYPWQIPPIGK